jgi:hypothetical protein
LRLQQGFPADEMGLRVNLRRKTPQSPMSHLGHFRPIQPGFPAGHIRFALQTDLRPDRIEIGHSPVIQASKLGASY